MYETYGEQVQHVVDIANSDKKQCVWTLIVCNDEESWIVPGYFLCNRVGYFITEIFWEDENIQINDNEMCTIEEAVEYCMSFGEEYFKMGLDKTDVIEHFKENLDFTFDREMTIDRAKYTAIAYYEDRLSRELDDFDEIHNYYSQLK
jgi:hypothetical protein